METLIFTFPLIVSFIPCALSYYWKGREGFPWLIISAFPAYPLIQYNFVQVSESLGASPMGGSKAAIVVITSLGWAMCVSLVVAVIPKKYEGYIDLTWLHDSDQYPYRIVFEINKDRYEIRKLEFYCSGEVGFADLQHNSITKLGEHKVPALFKITSQRDFEGKTISKRQFEKLWWKHVGKSGVVGQISEQHL